MNAIRDVIYEFGLEVMVIFVDVFRYTMLHVDNHIEFTSPNLS